MNLDMNTDADGEQALNLLLCSAFISKNDEWHDWKARYKIMPPHIHKLFAYIFEKELNQKEQGFLLNYFPEMAILKDIYDTIEPCKKTMKLSIDRKDYFEFAKERKEKEIVVGLSYFDDAGPNGKPLNCPKCGVSSFIIGSNAFRYKADPFFDRFEYQFNHQCQGCGQFKLADNKQDFSFFLQQRCECGGQFRRDKPLFCTNCNAREWDIKFL